MISRRAFLEGLIATTAGLLVPPSALSRGLELPPDPTELSFEDSVEILEAGGIPVADWSVMQTVEVRDGLHDDGGIYTFAPGPEVNELTLKLFGTDLYGPIRDRLEASQEIRFIGVSGRTAIEFVGIVLELEARVEWGNACYLEARCRGVEPLKVYPIAAETPGGFGASGHLYMTDETA